MLAPVRRNLAFMQFIAYLTIMSNVSNVPYLISTQIPATIYISNKFANLASYYL